MLGWIPGWVTARPKQLLVAFLALTLGLGYGISLIHVDTDVTRDLPKQLPAKKLYDRIDELFPSKEFVVVGIEATTIWTPEVLAQIDHLARALDELPVVQSAVGPTNAKIIEGTGGGGEYGIRIREVSPTPPKTMEDVERIREAITQGQGREMFVGTLVSRDGTAAAILVSLKAFLEDPEGDTESLREADAARDILDCIAANGGDLSIHPVGRPIAAYYGRKMMGRDMGMLSSAALVVIMLVLFVSFRSARGVLLPMGVVTAAVVWTLGLMGYLGVPLSHSTEVMPILLIAIGVADGIHILKFYYARAQGQSDPTEVVRRVLEDLVVPVVLTSLTSMAGFLSLLSSGVESIAILGIFTSFGILAAMVFSLVFIPAVLCLMPLPKRAVAPGGGQPIGDRAALAYGRALVGHKLLGFAAVAVVLGVSGWGATHVRAEMSTMANYKEDHPLKRDLEVVNRHFAGTSTIMVVVEGPEGVVRQPDVLRAMDDLERFLARQPHVGGTRSIVGVIKQLNRAMNEGDDSYYRIPGDVEQVEGVELREVDGEERVVTVTREVPGKDVVSDLLMALESSGRPSDMANAVNLPFSAAKITAFLDSDRATVTDRIHDALTSYIQDRFGPLFEKYPGLHVELTGMLELIRAVNHMVVRGQLTSLGVSLILVLLLTSILFRSLWLGLLSTLPLSVCIFVNFGFMGLVDFPLNLMTMVTANIAIGVGVDYAIHFVHRYREVLARSGDRSAAVVEALRESGVAIFLNALTVALGFGCLTFSSYLGVMQMGSLLALTTLSAAFAALVILPLVVLEMKPKTFGR